MTENFATSYRPQTFSEVVGQETVKAVLKKIAAADGIAVRSIFLKGSWGSGKSTMARIMGKALSCERFKHDGDICNECAGCKEASAKNSQTYFEFDATVAGNVDSIRNLHDKLSYAPPAGSRRLVVWDEIHAASNAALNALLKMVEEGMPNTIFMFCSTEDILPTLKSRSICLDITTVPKQLMAQRLQYVASKENIKLTDSVTDVICAKSLGHMRDALSLLQLYSLAGEDALKTPYHSFVKFIFACLKKKKEEANSLLQAILEYPVTDIQTAINSFLSTTYRSQSGEELNILVQKGMISKLFQFFYNPVAQQALRTEAGTLILLQSFIDKTNG